MEVKEMDGREIRALMARGMWDGVHAKLCSAMSIDGSSSVQRAIRQPTLLEAVRCSSKFAYVLVLNSVSIRQMTGFALAAALVVHGEDSRFPLKGLDLDSKESVKSFSEWFNSFIKENDYTEEFALVSIVGALSLALRFEQELLPIGAPISIYAYSLARSMYKTTMIEGQRAFELLDLAGNEAAINAAADSINLDALQIAHLDSGILRAMSFGAAGSPIAANPGSPPS